jgi:hypothetical protein
MKDENIYIFLRSLCAFFAASPQKTGLSGAPASPPAPARCAVAAPRPSYPLRGRKSESMRIFAFRSLRLRRKLLEMETAGILPA